jgi:hypothetical protein
VDEGIGRINIALMAKTQQIVCNAEIKKSFIGVWSETRRLVPAIPSHHSHPPSQNSDGQSVMEGLCAIIHRIVCLLSSHSLYAARDQRVIDGRMSLVCTNCRTYNHGK